MATYTEVNSGLSTIENQITSARNALKQFKAGFATQSGVLAGIPATYQSIIDTINGYAPNGAVETTAKDKLAKYAAEYTALKAAADAAVAALAAITEF
jgi:hypothetical protein